MPDLVAVLASWPIATLAVIAVVVVVGSRLQGESAGRSIRSVAIVLACYALARIVTSWADGNEARLELLLVGLTAVAVTALVRIAQKRGRRRTPGVAGRPPTQDATDVRYLLS